jgi:hypothetical protein
MFLRTLRRVAPLVAPAALLCAGIASAEDTPTPAALKAARELFMAAEKDEDAQRWSDALEKLQRVAQVRLTSGVRYHTALCEEHLGHLVAALNDYKAAADQARAENAADVLRLVGKRIADATERTPQVVVVVVPTAPDAIVLIDGQPVAAGASVPVDPGTHTIDASATGRSGSSTTVTVQERDATRIEVKLEPITPPLPPTPAIARPESRPVVPEVAPPKPRTLTIVAAATAAGLAVGGLGAYLVAGSQHTDAVRACAQMSSTRADACDAQKNGVRAWDWIAVGAWAGAAAAGTLALVSLVRSGRGDAAPAAARVVVGPAAMRLEGWF